MMLNLHSGKELDRVLQLLMQVSKSHIAIVLRVGMEINGMTILDQYCRNTENTIHEDHIYLDCLELMQSYFIEDQGLLFKKNRGNLPTTMLTYIYFPLSHTANTATSLFLIREEMYEEYFKNFVLDPSILYLKKFIS